MMTDGEDRREFQFAGSLHGNRTQRQLQISLGTRNPIFVLWLGAFGISHSIEQVTHRHQKPITIAQKMDRAESQQTPIIMLKVLRCYPSSRQSVPTTDPKSYPPTVASER